MRKPNPAATPVVFRVWPDGEVLALFPTLEADASGCCTSYAHLGQHGAADYRGCIDRTRPATDEEAAPLKRELERVGYVLEVHKRAPSWRQMARARAFERHRAQDPHCSCSDCLRAAEPIEPTCDACGKPNDRASEGNYCTHCRSAYRTRTQADPEYTPVGTPQKIEES